MPEKQSAKEPASQKTSNLPKALRLNLVGILTLTPDVTAREIESRLRSEGFGSTKSDINSRLYSDHDLFENDGSSIPKWRVIPGVALSLFPDVVIRPELNRALTLHPYSTATELARHLNSRGLEITKTNVNSILYSAGNAFWNDGATPPRWQIQSSLALGPATRIAPSPTDSSGPFVLYAWQAEAIKKWRSVGSRGVVEAVTGAGKTMVGLCAAWQELQSGGKVEILVPSIELLNQWAELAREYFPRQRLGLLGGGDHDSLSEVDILIAVVNSARNVQVKTGGCHALLIADECHRYASAHNSEALDEISFDFRLGLSATYERTDGGHLDVLNHFFGGTCFILDYSRAIADEVTAHFKVALVGVNFNGEEQEEYTEVDGRARRLRTWLINNADVTTEPFGAFMADVTRLADGGHGEETSRARGYLTAFSRRRQILADSTAKLELLRKLAPAVHAADRTIVFTERQESAEQAAETFTVEGLRAGAIHSGINSDTRRIVLAQFAQGALSVICAPRILDEGVDVPAADLAIILSASQSRRQMVQRMGRILRRKSDGRYARFVIAYVIGTSEDPALGAYGTFLEDIREVANDHRCFDINDSQTKICEFLNDFAWKGPVPRPRMA